MSATGRFVGGGVAVMVALAGCARHTFVPPEESGFALVSGRVYGCFIGCSWDLEADDGVPCQGFSVGRPRQIGYEVLVWCDGVTEAFRLTNEHVVPRGTLTGE